MMNVKFEFLKQVIFTLFLFLSIPQAQAQPSPPERLVSRAGDQSVILHWNPATEANLKGYRIYRATDENGPFEQPIAAVFSDHHFVDFKVDNGEDYFYRVRTVNTSDEESVDSQMISASPDSLDDEAFIELVQQTAFDYFWYEANPENGLIKDRNTAGSASSIAAVGFGLSALTVGIERGWLTREEGRDRVLATLSFFWDSPQGTEPDATGYKGFYYHFLNMETGRRSGATELSTIDTALLLAGVIQAGEYFDGNAPEEERIRNLADSLYLRVDWTWAQPRPPRIGHGWRPESGFIPFDWGGYNEAMIVYLLALGSPTHNVSSSAWSSWTSSYNWGTYYNQSFVVFPPLFGHQYTHAWYDFREIQDAYMRNRGIDYFENSRRATLANRLYAIDNPGGWNHYGENIWGLTASDAPTGYSARGAPPAQNDDGTIAPTAAGGSFAFTPVESLAALREMYTRYRTQLWWRYGFKDAFNPAVNWFDTAHLGIDQGPIVLMIENHQTGLIWDTFMQNEYVKAGLQQAGFEMTNVAVDEEDVSGRYTSFEIFPNPSTNAAFISYQLDQPAHIHLVLHDMLGRKVKVIFDGLKAAGIHQEMLVTNSLAAGVYVVLLRQEGKGSAPAIQQNKLVIR